MPTGSQGYSCACVPGFQLILPKSCIAINSPTEEPASLIFANSEDVQHVSMDGELLGKVATHETLALDFDHRNRSMCWVDHGPGTQRASLRCASVDRLDDTWTLPEPDLLQYSSLGQLAWDWAGGNWYLLDDRQEAIFICRAKAGEHRMLCKIVVTREVSKPRGLALDPDAGFIFFTEWGTGRPSLERAKMDGTQRTELVNKDIVYPYGVTLDRPNRHVYWVDTYLDYIERCGYNGEARRTIVRGQAAQNLYGLASFQNQLFTSSWQTNSILSIKKFHPGSMTPLLEGLGRPTALHVFHRQQQPLTLTTTSQDEHPCRQLDPCHHFCIPQAESPQYQCACRTGFSLSDSRTGRCSLIKPVQMLLLGQSSPGQLRGLAPYLQHGRHEVDEVMVPVPGLTRPTTLDFHFAENAVYFSDSQTYKIQRATILGEKIIMETLISEGLNKVEGLAVDWIGGNLYWSDEGLQAIFTSPLSTPSLRRTLFQGNMSHPRALALHPAKGLIFWSNWASVEEQSEASGTISLAWLTGQGRRELVTTDLHWPNGLTLDMTRDMIYWCDTWAGRIESQGYDDSHPVPRRVVYNSLPLASRPYGLTLLENTLFWTQYTAGTLVSLELTTNTTTVLRKENPQLFEVKAFSSSRQPVSRSPCSELHCAELCLLSPGGAQCACRDGHLLADDEKRCTPDIEWRAADACGPDRFQCGSGELRCLARQFVCDGVTDCTDGSDEVRGLSSPLPPPPG